MSTEIEIKLAASADVLVALRSKSLADGIVQSEWQERHLRNTYFDNDAFKLRELRIGMRIREIGYQYIQTVKSDGRAMGGLHQRNECEVELVKPEPDLTLVDDPYLMVLLEEAVEDGGPLKPVFTTDFDRAQCELTFEDGTRIEVALDQGTIRADGSEETICEVELELLEGEASQLFDLAESLMQQYHLRLDSASKARRGYRLCKNFNPRNRRMSVIELSQGSEAETAFELICYEGFNHWQYYESYINSRISTEAILQMYRALLYVQHVYQVFGGLISRQATSELRANWTWLAKDMEPIVELAKKVQYLHHFIEAGFEEDVFRNELDEVEQRLEQATLKLRKVLSSRRYHLMLLKLSRWLYLREWRQDLKEKARSELETAIASFAENQLEHMLTELNRALDPKESLTAQDYFAQIAVLRKALDVGLFFGSLFDTKKREKYRQPWLDILSGIEELEQNEYCARLRKQASPADSEEIERWLQQRNTAVLEAMEQTRMQALKVKPYWAF